MIELGWSRKSINRQVHRTCAIFRWAASKELLPESIYHRLKTLAPLKRGRTTARETPRVKPVPEHLITPLRDFLSRQVWAMIELQILAGPRPEDVVRLRGTDLKTGDGIWTAQPEEHKTAYREHRASVAQRRKG
jgi:integrase